MKNIHTLPTDKPSRLYNCFSNLEIGEFVSTRDGLLVTNQNIYITSDEEIKKEDWVYNLKYSNVRKIFLSVNGINSIQKEDRKIILTTDQDLIKDGVQAIDDDFLEWFVKNPSCESVDVDYRYDTNLQPILDSFGNKVLRIKIPTESENLSQIIIPKEGMNCWSGKKGVEGWPGKEEPKQTDWVFEISSGYNGYRNKNTGDWIYESEYLKIFNGSNQETPTELEPVLAKLSHINDLGTSQWYEVVYYDDNRWCSFSGSKTFEDGEKVIEWKYCKDCL